MIPTKARRIKTVKLSKNLERKYKELKCRECTVVVTPMDFAKILGRFTKVKIQYESSSKTKPKHTNAVSPTTRLKENGMVQVHRNAYNPHPAQKLLGLKKTKHSLQSTPTSNVLKENNRLKRQDKKIDYPEYDYNNKQQIPSKQKHYSIVFVDPVTVQSKEIRNKITLQDLLSGINKSILPSEDWCIDYFPKSGEPKDDKIYDRIAAELEDLMYSEKTKSSSNENDDKTDDFPSILDILNENTKDGENKMGDQPNTVTLESSDVEAMLLGNTSQQIVPTPMEVDNTNVSSLVSEVEQEQKSTEVNTKSEVASTIDNCPESPSILDEPVKNADKDVSMAENHVSIAEKDITMTEKDVSMTEKELPDNNKSPKKPAASLNITMTTNQNDVNDNTNSKNKNNLTLKSGVTQIIFKKIVDGICHKSVTCPKNLMFTISMLGKSVELLGAPKLISSVNDLQVLLQIVEESELNDLYVLH